MSTVPLTSVFLSDVFFTCKNFSSKNMTDFKVNMETNDYPTPDNNFIAQIILIQMKLIYYSGNDDNFWTVYCQGECKSNTVHTICTDASLEDILNLINTQNKYENLRVVEFTQWMKQCNVPDAQDIEWLTKSDNTLYFNADNELHKGILFLRIRKFATYFNK